MLQFILSALALLVVAVTMLARANDLRWKTGMHWNIRLVGFICTGFTPIGIIGVELVTRNYPNIYEALFRVGLAMVFVTTPYLPPWWKWITGKDQSNPYHSDDRRAPDKE